MISGGGIVDEIWRFINDRFRAEIRGGLYKYVRPANSISEDVVINIAGVNFEQLQSGLGSVNVFIPNPPYEIVVAGKKQTLNDLPDGARIRQLSDLFASAFRFHYFKDKHFSIELQEQPSILPSSDGKTTFINNRLIIRAKNL